ncbi:hypothetical protein Ocin01_06282 [Orchesella cincta]|uniref:Uncharacterized protein n=1 Tax=Orchesella cincta TaxID=48709 RepID=A0A1D2N544_ORCCI|nr:hypothetical protein Ocin01_06282 [Orchesella cincta]
MTPNRFFKSTLIPIEETVSWKIHNVSHLLKTNTWTAFSLPLEIGLGATELSNWSISLVRNKDSILCARAALLSPKERHRNVTHHLKVAVVSDDGPEYYLPNKDDPDFIEAKETSHIGEPTFWKIAHTTRISPDAEDCLELIVTMTVYGCDISEER